MKRGNTFRLLFGVFWTSSMIFASACNKTRRFTGSTIPRVRTAPNDEIAVQRLEKLRGLTGLNMVCSSAGKQINGNSNNEQLPGLPSQYIFENAPICSGPVDQITQRDATRPLDLIFVLDITGSMQENIDAIKNSLVNMTKTLEANAWEVSFAALGFRDYQEGLKEAEFQKAEDLKDIVATWRAEGGADYQEAGQTAIRHAVEKLKDQKKNHSSPQESESAILYVSNGAAYKDDNHNSFSVADLISEAKEWRSELPNLRFYHSIDPDVLAKDDPSGPVREGPDPFTQMQYFLDQSGLKGKALDYPLSKEVMEDFAKVFTKITTIKTTTCELQKSRLTTVAADSSVEHIEADIRDLVRIIETKEIERKATPNSPSQTYNIEVNKCCGTSEDFANNRCSINETIAVDLSFGLPE